MKTARAVLDRVTRAVERLHGTLTYVSAATLPLQALRSAQEAYWSDFALQDDDIDRGWFTWERDVAARILRPGMRVLLVGCGSGRDLIEMVQAGCHVTGVDMAQGPLRRAREKLTAHALEARLIHGWIEELPLQDSYDGVWFSWLSYSLIPMAARRVETLKRLSAHLLPGGVVVLDVLRNPPRTRAVALARFAGRLCRAGWSLEPGDVIKHMPGIDNYSYQHVFAQGEAEREVGAAGLSVVAVLHDDTVIVASPAAVSPRADAAHGVLSRATDSR